MVRDKNTNYNIIYNKSYKIMILLGLQYLKLKWELSKYNYFNIILSFFIISKNKHSNLGKEVKKGFNWLFILRIQKICLICQKKGIIKKYCNTLYNNFCKTVFIFNERNSSYQKI